MRIVDLSRPFTLGVFMKNPHSGTHLDSPAYAFPGGKAIGDFPPERFIVDAALLDLTHKRPGECIDDEDLEAAEESAGLALRDGEAAILHTCASEPSPTPMSFPYLSRNGADYLEFKGVSLVGVDSANIDRSESSELTAHGILLGKDIIVLEGLTNLGTIESSRFRLICLPLRLDAVTSPVRAVATLD